MFRIIWIKMKFTSIILLACFITYTHSFDWQSKLKTWTNKIKSGAIFQKAHKFLKHVIGGKKESNGNKPWFCHDLDCPPFTVVNKTDNYEERCYNQTIWVATGMTAPHKQETGFKPMFEKLYKYITGDNKEKQKVKMTAPVLVTMKMASKDMLDINMHFFVPNEVAENIPQPSSSAVKIVTLPPMCVYVHSFGGWMMKVGKSMKKRMLELEHALEKDGQRFDDSELMFGGYDSPFRLIGRHNEVMFLKKEKVDKPKIDIVA